MDRYIHLGNRYVLNMETMHEFIYINGSLDPNYKAIITSQPFDSFDLEADNNDRRTESQWKYIEQLDNIHVQVFEFEIEKDIFSMSSALDESEILYDDNNKDYLMKLGEC